MGVESSLHVRSISQSSCERSNVWRMRYRVPRSSDHRMLTVLHSSVSQSLSRIRSCQTPMRLVGPTWRTKRNPSEETLWRTHPRQDYSSKRLVATLERPRFMIPHACRSRRLSSLSINMVLGIQTKNHRYHPLPSSRLFSPSCIIDTNALRPWTLPFRDSCLLCTITWKWLSQ